MENFIDLDYVPAESDLVCLFYLEPPQGKTLAWSAEHVAGESSVGTWTDVKTTGKALSGLAPRVYSIDEEKNKIKIAYPLGLFEEDNTPQIMSSVAGNIFGMKAVSNLRLLDIQFPEKIVRKFKGPRFGIPGVRKLLKVRERPLIGTIIKPKLGLPCREHARVAYEAWVGGCDLVKSDENLTSQKFNSFKKRVKTTLRLMEKAEKETGERKAYLENITAPTHIMLKRAKFIEDCGGNYMMVDVVTSGMAAIQTLRDKGPALPIHAHRAGHAMFTRNPRHGMSMLVLAKLLRLIGIETCHIGSGEVGKMEGGPSETKYIAEEISLNNVSEEKNRLSQNWGKIKPVFPVASGGLHPGSITALIHLFGRDFVAQAGGGIHGHPDGTLSGAKAFRQAVEATMKDINLKEYSKTHVELFKAIEKWGITDIPHE